MPGLKLNHVSKKKPPGSGLLYQIRYHSHEGKFPVCDQFTVSCNDFETEILKLLSYLLIANELILPCSVMGRDVALTLVVRGVFHFVNKHINRSSFTTSSRLSLRRWLQSLLVEDRNSFTQQNQ